MIRTCVKRISRGDARERLTEAPYCIYEACSLNRVLSQPQIRHPSIVNVEVPMRKSHSIDRERSRHSLILDDRVVDEGEDALLDVIDHG